MNMNKMVEDLGNLSLNRIADGTWLCQLADGFGTTFSGNTPEQAVRAAWQSRQQAESDPED